MHPITNFRCWNLLRFALCCCYICRDVCCLALLLQVILIVGAMQMAMAAYGFQAPNMSKVIGAMLIGIAGEHSSQGMLLPA